MDKKGLLPHGWLGPLTWPLPAWLWRPGTVLRSEMLSNIRVKSGNSFRGGGESWLWVEAQAEMIQLCFSTTPSFPRKYESRYVNTNIF